jgi:sporulation protein YlmC with PRC-barrel domain
VKSHARPFDVAGHRAPPRYVGTTGTTGEEIVMMKVDPAHALRGLEVLDSQGKRIGKVREVWTDADSGQAAWATVDVGFLGRHHAFVPLSEAVVVPEHLAVSIPCEVVADAPRVMPTGETMAPPEEHALADYYRAGVVA